MCGRGGGGGSFVRHGGFLSQPRGGWRWVGTCKRGEREGERMQTTTKKQKKEKAGRQASRRTRESTQQSFVLQPEQKRKANQRHEKERNEQTVCECMHRQGVCFFPSAAPCWSHKLVLVLCMYTNACCAVLVVAALSSCRGKRRIIVRLAVFSHVRSLLSIRFPWPWAAAPRKCHRPVRVWMN